MSIFLKILGGIWAAIGAANIFLMPWTSSGDLLLTFGLIFNMMFFVVPGLILYGFGALIAKKAAG